MRLVVIGSDARVFDSRSSVRQRTISYGDFVDEYVMLVPDKIDREERISRNITIKGISGFNKLFILIKLYKSAAAIINRGKFDIITVPDPYYLALVGFLLAKRYQLALQIQLHGWEKENFLRKVVAALVIKRSNGIRTVSERLKRQLMRDYGIDESKISVVPIRVPLSVAATGIRPKKVAGEFLFLTASRLVAVKNISLQISALKKIIDQGINAKLVVVGSGPEAGRLKTLAFNLGVADKVEFVGWVDKVDEYYKRADAFLLTSNSEGWGLVAIEAALHGLPIIMTDVGCAGEVIKNEQNGLIIPIGDEAALVEAMKRLITDSELRDKLASEAVRVAEKLPDERTTLEKYKQGWENLLVEHKPRLLVITQKINSTDSILGFFHAWIKEFALYCPAVVALGLEKGKHDLPDNVTVYSLGKEKKLNRFKYLINFFLIIWRERKNYDVVFVHMNEMYVILGAPLWKLLGKKVGLWYAHGKVSRRLKIAERMADIIFTSTPSGFRLASNKLRVVGQGIDTERFHPDELKKNPNDFKLISIGRISPVKGYDLVIDILSGIREEIKPFKLTIIGEVVLPEHESYLSGLKQQVADLGLTAEVDFLGALPNTEIIPYLQESDLMINASLTGSLDKTMPEAMACGTPILTCNEAIKNVLPDSWEDYFFERDDKAGLAAKVKVFYGLKQRGEIAERGKALRQVVVRDHNLKALIRKIMIEYE